SGSLVDQLKVVPGTGALAASNAAAENCWVAPWVTVALAGVTTTDVTTCGGGVTSSSLQAPKVFCLGSLHELSALALRCSEKPIGLVLGSLLSMSVDGIPLATEPAIGV